MFSDPVFTIIAAVLIAIGVTASVMIVLQRRNQSPDEQWQETLKAVWGKVRPILTECFIEIKALADAKKLGGYEAMVEFAVNYIKEKVDSATFLGPEEKLLLSKEVIRALIEPRLRELYAQYQ